MKRLIGYALVASFGYFIGKLTTDQKIQVIDDKYSQELAMMQSALDHYDNMLADIDVRRGEY